MRSNDARSSATCSAVMCSFALAQWAIWLTFTPMRPISLASGSGSVSGLISVTRISPSVSILRANTVNERYLVVYLFTFLCSELTRSHSSGVNVTSFCTVRRRLFAQLISHLPWRCADGTSVMPRSGLESLLDHGVWVSRASRFAVRIE